MRTFDVKILLQSVQPYLHEIYGLHPEEWIADKANIALTNGEGDVSLFENEGPGVYSGHYFFVARGKQAVSVAKSFLREIFSEDYEVKIIKGLTPLQKLGARWLNKQLGFKSYGVIQTVAGPCEIVILTKDEWENKQ